MRLLGHAYDGVHIHPCGTLITSGIIRDWLRIDTDGGLYSSGLVGAQPQVAEGGLIDVHGQLTVPLLPRELPGTILLAVGACYNDLVLRPDGTLTPRAADDGSVVAEASVRYRISSGGREPMLILAATPEPALFDFEE